MLSGNVRAVWVLLIHKRPVREVRSTRGTPLYSLFFILTFVLSSSTNQLAGAFTLERPSGQVVHWSPVSWLLPPVLAFVFLARMMGFDSASPLLVGIRRILLTRFLVFPALSSWKPLTP